MLNSRYLNVLLLVCLLTIGQTESWSRRRSSRSRSRSSGLGRAARVADTLITMADLAQVFRDMFRKDRKRSTENAMPDVDICRFNTLDLNNDNNVTKEELATLIQSTGLEELEELFEQLDQNNDDTVAKEEYMDLYEDVCTVDLTANDQKNDKPVLKEDEYTSIEDTV